MQKRILLVDDESSIRRTLSLGLIQKGYDVEPCENGIEALKKIALYKKNKLSLDTFVLDVMLPDISGIRLGKIIKSEFPDAPMVFISGYVDKLNLFELSTFSTSLFLEKPFTAQDLTYQMEELDKQKNIKPVVSEKKGKSPTKSKSLYVLVKLLRNANFLEVYRKLYFMDNVLYCDTTKGEYDIFMLIQAENRESCMNIVKEKIKKVKGVLEVDCLSVGFPVLDDNITDIIHMAEDMDKMPEVNEKHREFSKQICSYILMEVEREKINDIYPVLRLDEKVVFCDYTAGKYNIVLFMYGTHFNEIDKFIEEKLVNMDGVLKIREFPVINMFDM